MKKIKFICVLFLCLSCILVLSSCGKSDGSIDKIYEILDDEIKHELEKTILGFDNCEFVLAKKNEMTKSQYNHIVEKLNGAKFDEAILFHNKFNDNYLLLFMEIRSFLPEFSIKYLNIRVKLPQAYCTYDIKVNDVNKTFMVYDHVALAKFQYDYKEKNGYYLVKEDAFLAGSKNISNVIAPNSVSKVLGYAYAHDNIITSFKAGEGLVIISDGAFFSAQNLKTVILNEKLKLINSYAFCYCTNLEYIIIPKGCAIAQYAFNTGNIFLQDEETVKKSHKEFAIGDANVYYAGEWEYNSEGIPTPLIDR